MCKFQPGHRQTLGQHCQTPGQTVVKQTTGTEQIHVRLCRLTALPVLYKYSKCICMQADASYARRGRTYMARKTISNTAIDVSDIGDVAVLRKPDGGTVYLLGSCHVSDSSASEAGELVRRVRPSTVVLELCDGRRGLLFEPDEKKPMAATEQNASTLGTSLADVAGSVGNVLGDWTHLIKMQYSALDTLDTPAAGGEFRAAAREADAVGAALVLGDRSVVTTTMRLKRLVPYSETILSFLLEDTEWAEKRAIERYSASEELKRTSGSLSAALKRPHSATREVELQALSAQLSLQTARTFESAVPGFSDAVMSGLMRRFWKKEVIGEPEGAAVARAERDASFGSARGILPPTHHAPHSTLGARHCSLRRAETGAG